MNTTQSTIPNHLAWSIIATVVATLCCCPLGLLGIVGIVQAAKVDKLVAAGDLTGAQAASNSAKTWSIVASVLAGIGLLINIGFYMTGGMQQYMEMMQAMQ
ncbi:MAG: CD225/dispanin family protein [Pseudomonadota bacterium]|nr:CD225/dispanin family protein [Pseudomonadota bacterium]